MEQRKDDEAGPNRPRVFVYGTLKRGEANHHLLDGATFLGDCKVVGAYTMVDLGWYPGVVRRNDRVDSEISGEVYEVDEPTLYSLDCLEGHPDFYERRKISTDYKNAWMYSLPSEYLERERDIVETGEWHGAAD